MGSVYPLLAIRDGLIEQKMCSEFLWVGTNDGVERELLAKEPMPYRGIKAGKWRRYFSWRNLFDWVNVVFGFFQALLIIIKFKPDLILTAGSFISVPVVLAGWVLRKKIIVHQQDLRVGFANRLMSPFACKITVAFDFSLKFFSAKKAVLIGNPARGQVISGNKERAIQFFNLEKDLPTLLVMGGSQGAEEINNLLFETIPQLILFCQIIHVTGRGNIVEWGNKKDYGEAAARYHPREYLEKELFDAYASADLVVCRAGISTLTELSAAGVASIVIPIPGSQQEDNADYFNAKNAIILLDQRKLNALEFVSMVKRLFDESDSRKRLSDNMRAVMPGNAVERYVELIRCLVV